MILLVKHPLMLTVALACLTTPALGQQPLPKLPPSDGPGAAAAASTSATASATPTAQQLYERVRRGLVVLQRNGFPVAIGTVLGTDGRIVTALSGLGGGDGADVLFADGTSVHAKVGYSDKATDLALLIPQTGKWTDGLSASSLNPQASPLHAMVPAKGARLAPAEVGIKGNAEAHSREGQPLAQMLDVDVKGPLFAGAPLLDASGDVAAVLVKACKGAAAQADAGWAALGGGSTQAPAKSSVCSPVVVAAPVTAIRDFLVRTPPTAVAPAPWLGIRGDAQTAGSVHGVQVVAVAPQSPAEKAGLKATSDVIAAVEGESVDSPERLSAVIGKHAPGDTVKLLVFGQGKFREVPVVLRAAP